MIILLILTAANYWVWQILANNFILGATLLLIELGLFVLITQKNLKKAYRNTILLSGLILLTLGIIFVRANFDRTLLTISPTEISVLSQRHAYLAEGLGRIFTNRYVLHYYKDYSMAVGKYERNIFYSLDPNLYFFRSHPREKAGIDEYDKYSPLFLPLFVLGIFYLILYSKVYRFLLLYFIIALLATGLTSPYYKLGPVLMFPFVNMILYLGLTGLIPIVKSLRKR